MLRMTQYALNAKITIKNNIKEKLVTFVVVYIRLLQQAVVCTPFFITSQQKIRSCLKFCSFEIFI